MEAAVAAIDEHGASASIAQIAEAAGMSKPVLYRYFSDKDDLYRAVGTGAPTGRRRHRARPCSGAGPCATGSSERAPSTSP